MGKESSKPTNTRPNWDPVLTMAWLTGASVLQVPFQRAFKFGPGNFGYNILIGTAVVALGVLALVGLVHLARRCLHQHEHETRLCRLVMASLTVCTLIFLVAFHPAVPFELYWIGIGLGGLAALLFTILICTLPRTKRDPPRQPSSQRQRKKAWQFNGAFWTLVLLVFLTRDFSSFGDIGERSIWESTLLVLGRLLSLGGFTMAGILLSHALLVFFPPYTRWLVIAGMVLIPLVVLADLAADIYWEQSLIDVVNNLTLDGRFDMKVELEAAGINQSPLQVTLAVLAVIALAIGAYFGLQKLSRRYDLRLRTSKALLLFAGLWMGAIAQQALSMVSMRKEVWQAEHATFAIHLGLFRPDPGLETLAIRFAPTQTDTEIEALLSSSLPALKRRPDIYIVMVETWRSDTVRPQVMPFLSTFAKEECQQFDVTFAGSNCTPVSWYTLFHSRIGIYWRDALGEGRRPGGFKGSYPIRLLHELGYRFSVRAVCDLSYKKMCDLNFGSDHKFAEHFLDAPLLPDGASIPEREKIIVADLKKQLESTPPGSHLHFLSLDSAHYNYYWPSENFTPIHEDCAAIDFGALKPTPEQIREVVKRYENAVNWIDRQMEEFINYLKKEDRYEDSIIIITGDHGEEFQENGTWFHCSSLRREQVEVPIMIKWPEWIQEQPRQKLVSHLDIMPSVLDALGLDREYFEGLAGHSVLGKHPGEALLSTRWPGKSNIGVCFVARNKKANFKASKLWLDGIPDTLYFMGWTNFSDDPLDPLQIRGRRSCRELLLEQYPTSVGRHFEKFEVVK